MWNVSLNLCIGAKRRKGTREKTCMQLNPIYRNSKDKKLPHYYHYYIYINLSVFYSFTYFIYLFLFLRLV